MNDAKVVRSWRTRRLALARQGWRCAECGRVFLVERRACAACGTSGAFARQPLGARAAVLAVTSAKPGVESLDHLTASQAAVLAELPSGARLACLLADAEPGPLPPELRGAEGRLVVRRLDVGALPLDEPITYVLKLAVERRPRAAAPPAASRKEE